MITTTVLGAMSLNKIWIMCQVRVIKIWPIKGNLKRVLQAEEKEFVLLQGKEEVMKRNVTMKYLPVKRRENEPALKYHKLLLTRVLKL